MALEQLLRCLGLGKTPGSQWARSSPKSWSPSPSLAWKLSLRACTRVCSAPPALSLPASPSKKPRQQAEPQLLAPSPGCFLTPVPEAK